MRVANNFGSRNANALFLCQLHESSSGIHDRETFSCAERTLDELANRGSRSPLTVFSAIEVVQVPSGEVVPWKYEVWSSGGDCFHERPQRRQAAIWADLGHRTGFAERMARRADRVNRETCLC